MQSYTSLKATECFYVTKTSTGRHWLPRSHMSLPHIKPLYLIWLWRSIHRNSLPKNEKDNRDWDISDKKLHVPYETSRKQNDLMRRESQWKNIYIICSGKHVLLLETFPNITLVAPNILKELQKGSSCSCTQAASDRSKTLQLYAGSQGVQVAWLAIHVPRYSTKSWFFW